LKKKKTFIAGDQPGSTCYALKRGHALFYEENCVKCDAM
jgi:hypothetical protein